MLHTGRASVCTKLSGLENSGLYTSTGGLENSGLYTSTGGLENSGLYTSTGGLENSGLYTSTGGLHKLQFHREKKLGCLHSRSVEDNSTNASVWFLLIRKPMGFGSVLPNLCPLSFQRHHWVSASPLSAQRHHWVSSVTTESECPASPLSVQRHHWVSNVTTECPASPLSVSVTTGCPSSPLNVSVTTKCPTSPLSAQRHHWMSESPLSAQRHHWVSSVTTECPASQVKLTIKSQIIYILKCNFFICCRKYLVWSIACKPRHSNITILH